MLTEGTPSEPLQNYPLSPMQSGMLFQSLSGAKPGINIEQMVCSFTAIDIAALKKAWEQVWQHHDVLRTSFAWVGFDAPVQRVLPGAALPWRQLDWRSFGDSTEQRLAEFLSQERREGFPLDRPPLMRLTLIERNNDRFYLVWTFHHILADGRAFPVILNQVALAYQALCQGQVAALPVMRPYQDYLTWLEAQDFSEAKAYWKGLLRGFRHPTPLVLDRPQPARPEEAPGNGILTCDFSPEMTVRFKEIVEQHGLTLNTLVQAAWAVLLHRYSGEQDILFGTVRTGRHTALDGQDTADMVGVMINTLPVRVSINPEAPCMAVLKDLRARALELHGSLAEHFPLAEIQRLSEVPSGSRLFDSLVSFEHGHIADVMKSQHPLLANWDFNLRGYVGFPLSIAAYSGAQLKLLMEYSLDSFDAETARRILAHFSTLLEGIASDPFCPVYRLPLLNEAELRQMLVAWSAPSIDFGSPVCLHTLFKAQAARTPEQIAVVFRDDQLTYRSLDQQSDRLAAYLQTLGVGPGTITGICVERSLDMAVGILGVLKAGGAFLPLDPDYPLDRLTFMLQDSGAGVLLSQRALHQQVPAFSGIIVDLDGDWLHKLPAGAQPAELSQPGDLAYVIYTSGSTGLPKGTMIEHRAIFNDLRWMQTTFPLGTEDAVLQAATICFDAALSEFFTPLLAGARLVLAEPKGQMDPAYLVQLIRQQNITTVQCVPTMLRTVLQQAGFEHCRGVKRVFCGGEALRRDLAAQFSSHMPDAALINIYGPTETTIDASHWQCPADGRVPETIPIGRPLANTQFYILDNFLQPVPVGVPGELHIGGAQLARGYLHRPELTAERFIANPFGSGRLYKTGDLARFRPDGNFEYMGRVDDQVKMRGFRIELGEIESLLNQHPIVDQAAVAVHVDEQGQQKLIGYITARRGDDARAETALPELRTYLKDRLPAYMVPSEWMVLPELPLTPSGKIDRRALPVPEPPAVRQPENFTAPRSDVEQTLAAIWKKLLKRDAIGIQDSFSDIGGHSILAIQMLSEVQRIFDVNISITTLVNNDTIQALANLIFQQDRLQKWPSIVEIRSEGSRKPLFCVHGLTGDTLWFFQLLPYLDPNQPVWGLESRGLDDIQKPLDSIEQMAAYYIQLMRNIQPEGPYYICGYSFGGLIVHEMAVQLKQAGQETGIIAILDQPSPKSGYERVKFGRDFLIAIAENIPPRLADLIRLRPDELLARVQRVFHALSHSILCRMPNSKNTEISAKHLIDNADKLPKATQDVIVLNNQALLNYHPKHYDGKVTLFRARGGGVFVSHEKDMGWSAFADQVEIRVIPGSHLGLFKEPNIRFLAEQIQSWMDAT